MTNEELLSVAEIVEKLTDRFNAQAALHRERHNEYDKLIASMKADHEAKMVEHRAAVGARTEADAQLITKLQNMVREQSNSAKEAGEMLGWTANESANQAVERVVKERDALRAEVAALQERLRASIARGDFAQMEVAALKSRTPTQHGRWVRATSEKCMHAKAGEVVSVRGYLVRTNSGEFLWEGKDCEPCDPPATHDTEAGKAAAESAVRTEPVAEPIKVGDVAKVVGASGDLTAQSDIGKIGEVLKIDFEDGTVLLSGGAGWVNHRDVRKVTT